MRERSFFTFLLAFVCTPLLLSTISVLNAQVMQSTSYQLQSDSINFSGGLSTSTNYSLESTAGEIATGESDSTSYSLKAGYQQMQTVFISLTGSSNVALSPSIGGVTGGTANGSTTVTVITDSPSGYQLTIQSSQTPAMQDGVNTIPDYNPGTDPDFSFLVGVDEAFFGYTPEGTDIPQRFQDNGALCNVSGSDTELACWDGLDTATEVIATNQNSNHPNGATTTIRFRVGVGSGVNQVPGSYIATTTVTALAL